MNRNTVALNVENHTDMKLDLQAIRDMALGCSFLGAGGGSSTYATELQLLQALERDYADIRLISTADLADDALVVPCGWTGAPGVLKEKCPNGSEGITGLTKLEEVMGREVSAVFPMEIGGQNGLSPLLIAAKKGIPVVDCDGMGRAFPQGQMVVFNIYGCSATPAVISDEHGNCITIETTHNNALEKLTRQIAIGMGGRCHKVSYPLSGSQVKAYAVKGTLSLARGIGREVRYARSTHEDPVQALFGYLRTTSDYRHVFLLFEGKIVDIQRSFQNGFSVGKVIVESFGPEKRTMAVEFKNEFLIARENGRTKAMVPDIISFVDRGTADVVSIENIKYGQRVKVVAASIAPLLRSEKALNILGPRVFDIEETYIPVEKLNANDSSDYFDGGGIN